MKFSFHREFSTQRKHGVKMHRNLRRRIPKLCDVLHSGVRFVPFRVYLDLCWSEKIEKKNFQYLYRVFTMSLFVEWFCEPTVNGSEPNSCEPFWIFSWFFLFQHDIVRPLTSSRLTKLSPAVGRAVDAFDLFTSAPKSRIQVHWRNGKCSMCNFPWVFLLSEFPYRMKVDGCRWTVEVER